MTRAAPRVALLLADLGAGGAERAMLLLAREFLAVNVPVDLVVLRKSGELLADIPDGVRVVALTQGQGQGKPWTLALAAFLPMLRYLRRDRPVAILSTLTGTNLFALLTRALAGVDMRLVLREAAPLANSASRVRRMLVRRGYRHADAVVAVARGIADELGGLGLPASRMRVIHNPVDVPTLRAKAAADLAIPGLGDRRRPLVLSVGRLVVQKDYGTLIRAFARLRETVAAQLLIVGEGPCRKDLEAVVAELGIGEDVFLPGHASNPYPAFRHADVFALSSRSEGFPNVLLEALALGVPVVATDCDYGPREILDNGKHGRLVPVGDVDALADALAKQLDRPATVAAGSLSNDLTPAQIAARYLEALLGEHWQKRVTAWRG